MALLDSLLDKYGGDLNGLVSRFESTGLGEKVKSWVGTGENESLSADEVKKAFGRELDELADKLGIGKDEAAEELAQKLPEAVNKATPTGSIPGAAEVKQAFS